MTKINELDKKADSIGTNREVKPPRAAPIAIGGTAVKCGSVGRCQILSIMPPGKHR